MVNFGADSEVVIREFVSPRLKVFASTSNVLGNFEVLLREGAHLVAELGGFAPSLNFNLTRNCIELVNVPRPCFLFNRQQLQVELLLIGFLEERNEELACL